MKMQSEVNGDTTQGLSQIRTITLPENRVKKI